MARPQRDVPVIARHIVDAVRDDQPGRGRGEVMIVHLAAIRTILGLATIKVAQPLFVLGVQTQNRPVTRRKRLAEPGDVLKLGVPHGTLPQTLRFLIAASAETAQRQERCHQIPADGIPGVRHFSTDLPRMQADPTGGLVLGCPGDIGSHRVSKRADEARVLSAFFSVRRRLFGCVPPGSAPRGRVHAARAGWYPHGSQTPDCPRVAHHARASWLPGRPNAAVDAH
jgi:hypothetical protein